MTDSSPFPPEQVERVRQQIMRYRELLDILHSRLRDSERAYNRLFETCTDDEKNTLREKELQRVAAVRLLENGLTPLSDAVLTIRFDARDMEREFDHLHGLIVSDFFQDDEE
jgi:hypothetical protein